MEIWTYEDGYWSQIEAYVAMVEEIRRAGFVISADSFDKLEFAKSLATQTLNEASDITPEDRRILNELIGRAEALLDNLGSTVRFGSGGAAGR
jgi:hypothetical protein